MADKKLRRFVRENWAVLAAFLTAVILALFLASRVFLDFLYFNDPKNVNVDLKPWMTPRFVVQTYDLPRPFVFELLGLDPERDRGLRLGHLAKRHGLTMEELTAQVREAAEQYRDVQK